MQLPISAFIGLRYTRAKRSSHFISLIALISMVGIALGVTVLITVLSVMNGFENELRERILGMAPHVVVVDRSNGIADWQSLAQQVDSIPSVKASAPFVDAQAMLRHRGYTRYGLVQGVLPEQERKVSIVGEHMVAGKLDNLKAGEFGIVLGSGLARSMAASLGDKVVVLVPDGTTVSPVGVTPRYKRFTVVGIFEVRAEVDSSLALIHMADAQKLTRRGDAVSALRIETTDVLKAARTAYEVQDQLGFNYYVSDWSRTHGALFRAIKMEKTMMFILLTFIIAVAAFNIISSLVMVVTDKRADIAILRTLGASPRAIMGIFMVQGSVNGVIGLLLGLAGGISLSLTLPDIVSWVEQTFEITLIPGDVYFVGFLPSKLDWEDVFQVGTAALIMCLSATLYPAWKAAKTKPAEALRYE